MYLQLVNNFWKINEKENFSSSVISLYFFLLKKWQDNNFDEFKLSDNEICSKIKITKPTITKSKEILRNNGLIVFIAKNGVPSVYKLNSSIPVSSFKKQLETDKQPAVEVDTIEVSKQVKKEVIDDNKSTPTTSKEIAKKRNKTTVIPTYEEFLNFAKSLEIYNSSMDFQIQTKYETWKENNWRNGYDTPIKNWKNSLKSSMPYFSNSINNKQKQTIPNIKRPQRTYDE